MVKTKLVNASGHPLPLEHPFEVVLDLGTSNVDLADPAKVLAAATKIAEAAAQFVRDGALIALPGMSILSASVLAVLHGLLGHWPSVAYAARIGGVFTWSKDFVIDLHELRTEARTLGRV